MMMMMIKRVLFLRRSEKYQINIDVNAGGEPDSCLFHGIRKNKNRFFPTDLSHILKLIDV